LPDSGTDIERFVAVVGKRMTTRHIQFMARSARTYGILEQAAKARKNNHFEEKDMRSTLNGVSL